MKEIVGFYRAVFEQELSQAKQLHFYSSKIVKRIFIAGKEELINEEHPLIPISESKALPLAKEMAISGTSTELKYYSMARLSRFTSFNKYDVTRAYPLLVFDAEMIEKEGEFYIQVDLTSRKILKNNFSSGVKSKMNFTRLESIKESDFQFMSQLSNELQNAGAVYADDLRLFPDLWSSRKLQARMKTLAVNDDAYVPCAALCLVEKEKYAYSTLDELKLIEQGDSFSAALSTVFKKRVNTDSSEKGIVCEELNFWQQQAIDNSNQKTVSVISGPPGTGKSYTIANIAAEKVSKGQSVLISSKNGEALEVIENKIKNDLQLENLAVNPSKNKNLASLKDYLKFILGRSYKKSEILPFDVNTDKRNISKNIEHTALLEKEMATVFEGEKAILRNVETNKLTKHASVDFKNRIIQARGIKTIPLWKQLAEYYGNIERNKSFAKGILQRHSIFKMEENIRLHRADLRLYYDFLRARDSDRKNDLYSRLNHQTIISTFPVWLVKASEIASVIPNEKELFDYLIIDEASQCDIPSIIPLLQRAKKCIVVGDQNQLGHISFLSKSLEVALRENVLSADRHLCQHRDNSFLSLVQNSIDPADVSYLSEHFRSKHAIIEFSNKEIYNNQLDILTKRPVKDDHAVEFIKSKGANNKSVNLIEIEQITNKIADIILKEKSFSEELKTTIGVLSPFRNQVDGLFIAVKKRFTLKQIQAHKLMVGTAFSFQGNERDLMMLSLVVDDKSSSGSFNYVNRKDVFNVSVTRARNKQLVYYSFDPMNLKFESTLQLFFSFYEQYTTHSKATFNKDKFCKEIQNYIAGFGFETWQQFEISGVSIDVLAVKDGQYIAIDLVGFPGDVGDFYELERYKMLERGKIKLFPLPYAYWLYDKSFCLRSIEKLCLAI
ncbi:MAG: AAA domain-containing protein [Crocinitomicaceae bacterium]